MACYHKGEGGGGGSFRLNTTGKRPFKRIAGGGEGEIHDQTRRKKKKLQKYCMQNRIKIVFIRRLCNSRMEGFLKIFDPHPLGFSFPGGILVPPSVLEFLIFKKVVFLFPCTM